MTIRKFIWALGTTVLFAAGLVLTFGPAASATSDEVCPGLDSGKIDTTGDPQSVTVDAPAGQLISGYCVKGGSEGPIFVTVDPPAASVTIDYPGVNGGGQQPAVSHYSLTYVPVTTTVPTTAPTTVPTTEPPPTTLPTGSIDVDKTVDGDPECPDDEPCFVIDIDCEDLDFRQVYDGSGHLIEGDSTYHDIPPGTVCIVTETDDGGADSVTYDPANANTTGVVITPEDPENGRDQRVHVMVTNHFDECEVDCEPPTPVAFAFSDVTPPTCEAAGSFLQQAFPGVSITVDPPFDGPGTYTVTATLDDPDAVWEDIGGNEPRSREITVEDALGFQSEDPNAPCFLEPPPTTVPPTTVVPPPTTVVPPPPSTVPTCEDDPSQNGCARESLPRTGSNTGVMVAGALVLLAAGFSLMKGRKYFTA